MNYSIDYLGFKSKQEINDYITIKKITLDRENELYTYLKKTYISI